MNADRNPADPISEDPSRNSFQKIIGIFQLITIEPVVFFYAVGYSITMVVSPGLYLEKICTPGSVIFGNGSSDLNLTTCKKFDDGNHTDLQDYIQKTNAEIQLVTMFVKGIPPIIFALFVGPWSDKFGRKFLIMFPLLGYVGYNLWFLTNVLLYDKMYVEFLMLEVIQFWFGGYMCFFLGVYSYISDTSNEKTRTVRIALLDFVFYSGLAAGEGVSGEISARFGYEAIYGLGATFQCLAIGYCFFFVKESRNTQPTKDNYSTIANKSPSKGSTEEQNLNETEIRSTSPTSFFSLTHIKESFGVAFKSRPGGIRHVVIILIFLFGFNTFANVGISSINVTYARKKFTWGGTDEFNKIWAQLHSIGTVFNLFALGVLIPIMTQVLKMKDLSITIFCVISSLAGLGTLLLAKSYKLLYLANFLRMFADVTTIGIRSTLSKIVGEKDVGKVFACIGAIQAIFGLMSPIYQYIYKATYDFYLGFVYVVAMGILSLMLAQTIYVFFFLKKYDRQMKMAELSTQDQDTSENNKDNIDGPNSS